MTSNLLNVELEDILATTMAEDGEELLVVNPSGDTIEAVVSVATSFEEEPPAIRLLADERTLKDVMDDFIVASNAADLIGDNVLELRTLREIPENSLLITEDRVIAIVQAGSEVGGLTAEDESFVDAANETYSESWGRAHPFSLRTPPLSRVRQTLETEISPEVESDFTSVLDSLETARGNGEGLDEVTISLLVAAKNEALLYDISKWGEDVGIASKATFSRTKTKLEDMGLLDTEKVPIDVGRPRLRLKLGDERLRDADSDQLASVAQSLLN